MNDLECDVLVVGAGYVGSVAATVLAEAGHRVVAVRRTPSSTDITPGLRWLGADLTDDAGIARLPTRARWVVVALSPVGGRDEAAYRLAHVAIPRAVVGHLDEPPEGVALTTSTAVYDIDDGSVVDEDSPTTPSRPTARVLVEAERALRELAPTSVALRLGGIYGPGRTRLIDQVRAGEASCAPGQWTNRIHRDDAGAAIAHVVGLARPPSVVNVVDDTPTLRCEVLAWLAERLGAPTPRVLTADEAQRTRGGSKRISNALIRSTGWTPAFASFREGYAAMIPS